MKQFLMRAMYGAALALGLTLAPCLAWAQGAFNVNDGTGSGTGWSFAGGVFTITGDVTISGTGAATGNRIVVGTTAPVHIKLENGVNINRGADASGPPTSCAFDMSGATVFLTLAAGSNTVLTSGNQCAGLRVPADLPTSLVSTLTIDGTGQLTASGGNLGAGIGSGSTYDAGTITINGGVIVANGGAGSAGIGGGGGGSGDGGSVTINGGTVTATGGSALSGGVGGSGIGNGSKGNDYGSITITGGTVMAYGGGGGASGRGGAGIGGGTSNTSSDVIVITGGTVTATGGSGAIGGGAGIGGGYDGTGGNITITGNPAVNATGGAGTGGGGGGAGIGSGGNRANTSRAPGSIKINAPNVTANGGAGSNGGGGGAGIGSGGNANTPGQEQSGNGGTISTLTVTVIQTGGGTIVPGTTTGIPSGANKTFDITPGAGYILASVTVDGVPHPGAYTSWTISNITTNHTITATFLRLAVVLHGSVVFADTTIGGTLPELTLTCSPAATPDSILADTWTAPQNATCQLGLSGGSAPAGYTLALSEATYAGTGVSPAGAFTVPAADVTDILVTVPFRQDTQVILMSSGVTFDPAVSGGTLPALGLTCVPPATPDFILANTWKASQNAACQLNITGGAPPAGYTMGMVTYSGTDVSPTGAFTVLTTDITDLAATVALTPKAAVAVSGSVVFNPNNVGGTPPVLTLTCSAPITPTGPNAWLAPQDATCQLGTAGGEAPAGYTMGTAAYSGTGVSPAGAFTVPAAGVDDLVGTVLLDERPTVNVSGSVAFEPNNIGGTPPDLTLTCSTPVTPSGANVWQVPQGATCQLGVDSNGTPPAGYAMGAATYGGADVAITGEFTVPASDKNDLAATVPLATKTAVNVSGSVAFNPNNVGGTPPDLTLTCSAPVTPNGTNAWLVPQDATCTLDVDSNGAAPAGYTMGTATYSGTGVSGTTLTVPAAGVDDLVATVPLATKTAVNVSGSVAFDPDNIGGTPPDLTLTCSTPVTPNGANAWQVPQDATCQLGTTGGAPPAGYAMGTATYSGAGVSSAGVFTVTAAGVTNIVATVPLATKTTVNVSGSVAFNPNNVGGTPPGLTLTCSSPVTPNGANAWQVPQDATCQLGVDNTGAAPAGYTMGTATYSGTGVASAGAFTVTAAGVTNIVATVPLTTNALVALSGSVAFSPAIAGGTLPTLTLTCSAPVTPTGVNAWTVPQGATCQLAVTGGTAPNGRTFGNVTYGGAGVNPMLGTFTVPTTDANDLSATIALRDALTSTTPIPTLDPRMLALLALLIGAAGWLTRRHGT